MKKILAFLFVLSCAGKLYAFVPDDDYEQPILSRARQTAVVSSTGTIMFLDNFNESGANTALESHTPDRGGTWSAVTANNTSFTVNATNDELTNEDAGFRNGRPTATPVGANQYEEIRGKTVGTGAGDDISVSCRQSSNDQDYYHLLVRGTGAWELVYSNTGVESTLGSGTISAFSASTYYVLGISCVGTTIIATQDANTLATVTDSHVAGPGQPALSLNGQNAVLDYFVAYDK